MRGHARLSGHVAAFSFTRRGVQSLALPRLGFQLRAFPRRQGEALALALLRRLPLARLSRNPLTCLRGNAFPLPSFSLDPLTLTCLSGQAFPLPSFSLDPLPLTRLSGQALSLASSQRSRRDALPL